MDYAWAREFEPLSELRPRDLGIGPLDATGERPWARHRRYERVALPNEFQVNAITACGQVPLATRLLSLGGGIAQTEARVAPGSQGRVSISAWKNMTAAVMFREAPRRHIGFEIVSITLQDRARLRRLLSSFTS
jgi:hypothetical protein